MSTKKCRWGHPLVHGALWLTALLTVMNGCGWEDPPGDADAGEGDSGTQPPIGGDDGGSPVEEEPLMPFATGHTWRYQVIDRFGTVRIKTQTIHPPERVGGTGPHADEMGHRVVTAYDGQDVTRSWRVKIGDRIVRLRDQSFDETGALDEEKHWDPYKIYVDGSPEHWVAGTMFTETYEETRIRNGEATTETVEDLWLVDAVDQSVTVPAGTFRAIVFSKADGGAVKTFWYVPGIGQVKEAGGQTEELIEFRPGTEE